MRKPAFCKCENIAADQLRGNREADQRLFFAIRIVQSLYYLNPKFQASIHLLWLYRPVSRGTGKKPEDRFSHKEAHFIHRRDDSISTYVPVSTHSIRVI